MADDIWQGKPEKTKKAKISKTSIKVAKSSSDDIVSDILAKQGKTVSGSSEFCFEELARSGNEVVEQSIGNIIVVVGTTATRKTVFALSGQGRKYYLGTEYGADKLIKAGFVDPNTVYVLELLDKTTPGYREKFGEEATDVMNFSKKGLVKYDAIAIMGKITNAVKGICNSLDKMYLNEESYPEHTPTIVIDTWDDFWLFGQQFREEFYTNEDYIDYVKAQFPGWDGSAAWAKAKSLVWGILDSFRKYPVNIVLICRGYPSFDSEGAFVDYSYSAIKNTDFRADIILYSFGYIGDGFHQTSCRMVVKKTKLDTMKIEDALTDREYINPTLDQVITDYENVIRLNAAVIAKNRGK